jgi:hypothetical protein
MFHYKRDCVLNGYIELRSHGSYLIYHLSSECCIGSLDIQYDPVLKWLWPEGG